MANAVDSLREQATFYRAALLLGLVPGTEVVRWAETVVGHLAVPPADILELVLTHPDDRTALRAALQPTARSHESAAVCRAILALTAGDLAFGRRSVRDTVTVLTQISSRLSITQAWARDIDTLADDFMLATAGVVGQPATAEAAIVRWLSQFDESCHGIRYADPAEAAAFIGALSRVIQSPQATLSPTGAEAKVWASPPLPDAGVVLYLNRVALELAQSAFSPVPVIESTTQSALPATTRLVLTGGSCQAMGVDEAERGVPFEAWT